MKIRLLPALLSGSLALLLGPAAHAAIVDAAGDYVPGYAGSKAGDLDVLSASASYNVLTHKFNLTGTMAANVGTSPSGFYVWGANRGTGTARFLANGISGVLFDTVVIINADGSGAINDLVGGLPSFALPAGTASISGATVSLDIDEARLPSRGFSFGSYTWNLWPRDSSQPAGFAQISDFAPDNSNFTNAVVPEPTSLMLAGLGLAAAAVTRRRAGA